jgi:glucose-1-phosphate thymidylyltransferase
MCHEENDLKKQQKTAIIVKDENDLIVSYEEKPQEPKGNLAVPPFYYYSIEDTKKIVTAIEEGCNTDAPGSFAAWLSKQTKVYAWTMSGRRYDIGDMKSYEFVQNVFDR